MTDPFRAPVEIPPPEPLGGRKPRLLAAVHIYGGVGGHNAGAEAMLHAILRHLQQAGWEVAVWASMVKRDYSWQGIDVVAAPHDRQMGEAFAWCDVALTHLDCTRRATTWARRSGRPLVHLVHNHRQLRQYAVRPERTALAAFNSEWIADSYAWWNGPGMVVRPPVFSADYRTDRTGADADRVTLVNLNESKGGALLYDLAERLPEHRFLGVVGAYGAQVVPAVLPPNVEVQRQTANMVADVYARTRVLIVPSRYESWGRVAVEAMASGIPVVCAKTPGLSESMVSPGGVRRAMFCDRDRPEAWEAALRQLAEPEPYAYWSEQSLARSAELDVVAAADLAAFTDRLTALLPVAEPALR